MSFLYLIKEHNRVRFTTHSLSELTTLIVAYVAWRRTDKTCYAELLLIFRHVDTSNHLLVVKQVVGKCLSKLCLTHTRGTEEDEAGDWTLRVLQSGT